MPAFLDAVTGGSGLMRGCLLALNRLGQGVPPIFSANFLKGMRRKKPALVAFTTLMSLPFLAMSLAWFAVGGQQRVLMSVLFLAMYFTFFVLYGLYLVSFGTVQGKLIRPTRRGHLIVLSTFWGAVPATLVAFWLMPYWLEAPGPRWGYIFFFVGRKRTMCNDKVSGEIIWVAGFSIRYALEKLPGLRCSAINKQFLPVVKEDEAPIRIMFKGFYERRIKLRCRH